MFGWIDLQFEILSYFTSVNDIAKTLIDVLDYTISPMGKQND